MLILEVAILLRFYGLNWDQNQHLHPDERFLTMVTQAISWPGGIREYFSTSTSPLNPHNQNFPFFVYGTFPLFLIKFLSEVFSLSDYNHITLSGRFISTLFDLSTVFLIFLIGKKVFSNIAGLLGAFFYSVSVLPIQLAHFYAVDTFLNFFLVLTTYLLIRAVYSPKLLFFISAGISYGLAFASKVSAFLLGPSIVLIFLYLLYRKRVKTFLWSLSFICIAFLVFRIAQPYAFSNSLSFTPNPKFLANLNELRALSQPNNFFPPAVMWNNTSPIFYPLKELVIWALGIQSGIIILAALFLSIIFARNYCSYWTIVKNTSRFFEERKKLIKLSPMTISSLMLIIAILTIFIYQGLQFAKPLRYFYPLLPYLLIISGYLIWETLKDTSGKFKLTFIIILFLVWSIWPLAYMSIYTRPHPRVQASEWIYQNVEPGSTLSTEHWDDALPLNFSDHSNSIYKFIEFPLYGQESAEKWMGMIQKLQQVDYIILSSNRLYGGITRNPQMYPITSKYYHSLFNEKLGFEKIAEFTSRPNIYIPGINVCITFPFSDYGVVAKNIQDCPLEGLSLVDDYVDETNTVYDHPKVIIFRKTSNFSPELISKSIL